MEKNYSKFLASVLAEATLTDEQADSITSVLFPALDDTPRAALTAAKEAAIAYERFKARDTGQLRRAATKDVKPMNDAELDELAEIM